MRKTIKDAVDKYNSSWPEHVPRSRAKTFTIGERIYGNVKTIGEIRALREDYSKAHFRIICTRGEFEDYVATNQEEKAMTKYKNIPVENMTIWQLGQAVSEGGEFYDAVGNLIFTSDKHGTLYSHQTAQVDLNDQLMSGQITTREPIMWWDELPKLVMFDGGVYTALNYNSSDTSVYLGGLNIYRSIYKCTPLTREEAAEYGVE